ncbi:MAG: galactose-6-phosphate isomerase subunit LacA [Lactobacillales bacterium]|nr:galactose-6-phosphate isomerase subunit LacA [Lactobacillales bacterium]
MQRVIIGSDEAGNSLKENVKAYLLEGGYEVEDVSITPSEDFVVSTTTVAQKVLADDYALGIVFDAYGAGSFMVATKIKGMVAAEVSDERSAYMTREHNNARMLTMGSEIVGVGLAKNIVQEFLSSDYAGGRHQIRVDMLNKMA